MSELQHFGGLSRTSLVRLLAEANAVLTAEQKGEMAISMDTQVESVLEDLRCNEDEWEGMKAAL